MPGALQLASATSIGTISVGLTPRCRLRVLPEGGSGLSACAAVPTGRGGGPARTGRSTSLHPLVQPGKTGPPPLFPAPKGEAPGSSCCYCGRCVLPERLRPALLSTRRGHCPCWGPAPRGHVSPEAGLRAPAWGWGFSLLGAGGRGLWSLWLTLRVLFGSYPTNFPSPRELMCAHM